MTKLSDIIPVAALLRTCANMLSLTPYGTRNKHLANKQLRTKVLTYAADAFQRI